MSPLYLRREPTTDPILLAHFEHVPAVGRFDVVAYDGPDCTRSVARWNWFGRRPDRRNRFVMLNCARRPVVWLGAEGGAA